MGLRTCAEEMCSLKTGEKAPQAAAQIRRDVQYLMMPIIFSPGGEYHCAIAPLHQVRGRGRVSGARAFFVNCTSVLFPA